MCACVQLAGEKEGNALYVPVHTCIYELGIFLLYICLWNVPTPKNSGSLKITCVMWISKNRSIDCALTSCLALTLQYIKDHGGPSSLRGSRAIDLV